MAILQGIGLASSLLGGGGGGGGGGSTANSTPFSIDPSVNQTSQNVTNASNAISQATAANNATLFGNQMADSNNTTAWSMASKFNETMNQTAFNLMKRTCDMLVQMSRG